MTTFVGKQALFAEALYSLCELDFDAAEAYKAAINRLEAPHYKKKLTEFLSDHESHINEITQLLKIHHHSAPHSPDMKQYLTQGKVVLATILGDHAILKAMVTNEVETNTAYERLLNHPQQWEDARPFLNQGFMDEQKHKAWLEETLDKKEGQ